MNLIDKLIAPLAPSWALARTRARAALRILAEYEAGKPSRVHKARKDGRSANAQNQESAQVIARTARFLEQNLDVAAGALDVLVANTVGPGIQPEPQVKLEAGGPADEFNAQLMELWDDWIATPEVTQQFDYYSTQRLAARSLFRDGEIFAQHIVGTLATLDHGTLVPYSLEMLEADFVPYEFNDARAGWKQGIRFNTWGRPTSYTVYKSHPGETGFFAGVDLETKEIAAEQMLHVKLTKRFHQIRGMSIFASVINRLDDLKEIDESERVAARVAAAMAAYIKKGTPDIYDSEAAGTAGSRQMEFAPGMVFDDLLPGEDVGVINSNRPNNALIPFRDAQLRSAAAGFGTSYSSLSKNYNGTYSAQRQELVEQFAIYRQLSAFFSYRFCQPVWEKFVDAAVAGRKIKLAGINKATLYNATHTPPPMPWIDPVKEAEANGMLEDRGYKSRSRIIRERGEHPDQVNREIQRDQAEVERLGIKLNDGPMSAAPQQPEGANNDSSNGASQ